MKKVVFIRHAKSSWDEPSLSDIERPLNRRGLQDAPKMADYLRNTEKLDALVLISSIAKRARQTAEFFAKAFAINTDLIVLNENLYYGHADDYIQALHGLDENVRSCLVFGHNPNVEHLASQVSNPYMGQVPTCCMLICTANVTPWNAIQTADLTLIRHVYPKMI